MKIQEAVDILNKLSPDELGLWETNFRQMFVQTAILKVSVPIDLQEFDKLPEDKIKALIHNRMISALKDKLTALTEKGFINR